MKQKSLTINAMMNMINQVSGVLFPLITFPYISRILQPEGLGKVNFAQAIVGYFIMIASLGIPLYGTREAARVRDDKQKLSQLAAELFSLNVIMTLFAFAAFGIFMAFSEKAASDPLLFWICTLPMLLAPVGFGWLFQGLEEFTFVTIRTIVFRILTLIAIFVFIHNTSDFWIYVLIIGLNAAGANLINLFYAQRYLAFRQVNWRKLRIWKHLKPVLVVFSLGAVISIYTSLDKVMLGYLTNETQVGYYAVADRLIKVVVMIVTTLGAVLLPRISYYLENKNYEEYGRVVNLSLRVVSFSCLPAAFGLFVMARPLVLMFSGEAFIESVLLVKILGLNVVFIALSNFMGFQVLYPQNKEKLLVFSVLFGALTNFGLNWILIPKWQAIGAAVATLIAECSVTVAQIAISRPYQKFVWPTKKLVQYGTAALLMAVVIDFVLLAFESIIYQLVICIPVGMATYFFFLMLKKDEVFLQLIRTIPIIIARVKSIAN